MCRFFSLLSLCLFSGTTRPLYWQHPVYELDDRDSNNNGFINDDLIVWMREAAFPNFKKLYGVLNRAQGPFTEGLPAGNYTLSINYNILAWWRTELVVNGRKLFNSTDRLSVWWQNLFKQLLTNLHSHNVTFLFKGMVPQKITMMLSLTHFHVILNQLWEHKMFWSIFLW